MSKNINKTIRKWSIETNDYGRLFVSDEWNTQSVLIYGLDNDGIPQIAYDSPLSIPKDVKNYINKIAYLFTGVIASKGICNNASIKIYYLSSYYVVVGMNNDIPKWYKVYETTSGRPYFNFKGTREYLDDYIRLS